MLVVMDPDQLHASQPTKPTKLSRENEGKQSCDDISVDRPKKQRKIIKRSKKSLLFVNLPFLLVLSCPQACSFEAEGEDLLFITK